jgi:hypothetical protein
MANNGYGHTNGKTAEEIRGQELETLYDRLDHKLRDLPPGWRQLAVKQEPGTSMFSVSVLY